MEDLNFLQSTYNSIQQQLAAKRAEKRGYLNKAAEIRVVYSKLAEDKNAVEGYRTNLFWFMMEPFDTFVGKLYEDSYKAKVRELVNSYNEVIGNIDTNLDRLNKAATDYENKAFQCDGPIGYLVSMANSLYHQIQNWVN